MMLCKKYLIWCLLVVVANLISNSLIFTHLSSSPASEGCGWHAMTKRYLHTTITSSVDKPATILIVAALFCQD